MTAWLAMFLSAMLLGGDAATSGPSGEEIGLRAPGARQGIEADRPGIIRGKVRFLGATPPRGSVEVKKDREFCGNEIIAEESILNQDGGVANAVVSVKGPASGDAPAQTVALDNRACAFVPHVPAITKGSTLEIQTSDPVIHTVHLYLGNRTLFNLALPRTRRGSKIERKLEDRGLIKVLCDVHSWMKAYILVLDHPYFGLTDERGLFEIRELPPGSYRLQVWHELLGVQVREASVTAGKDSLVEFVFP